MAWTSSSYVLLEGSAVNFIENIFSISVVQRWLWEGQAAERFGALGLKSSWVLPVCTCLINSRKALPLSHPHSAYSKPWPCPERTPDGSCRCSEHKGFLVCAGVYQCLNRTGGSTGTPYQQLIRAPGFPCTFAGLWSLPSSISTKLKIARPGCTALR